MTRSVSVFISAACLVHTMCSSFQMNDDTALNLFPSSADLVGWEMTDNPAEQKTVKIDKGRLAEEYGIHEAFIARYKNEESDILYTVYDAVKIYYAFSFAKRISSPVSRHNRALRFFSDNRHAVFYKEKYVVEVEALVPYNDFHSDCEKVADFLNSRIPEKKLPAVISAMVSGEEYPVYHPESVESPYGISNYFIMTYDFDGKKQNLSFVISDDLKQASSVFDHLLRRSVGAVLTESDKDRIFYIRENETYSVFVNSGVFNVIVKGSKNPAEGRKNAIEIVKKLELCYKEKY